MFHIISYVSNIFQTVYPRVVDSWMSNFDSQLQNCFVLGGQPEVPGLGDVLPPGGRQDLHHGAVPAVQDGAHRTQQESLVSLDSRDELPRGDKFNVLARDSGPTLSERVLLHNDAAFLGLDFMKELAVEAPQVRAHVPVDVVHCSFCFDDVCSSCAYDYFAEQGDLDSLFFVYGFTSYLTESFSVGTVLGTCFLTRWDLGQGWRVLVNAADG